MYQALHYRINGLSGCISMEQWGHPVATQMLYIWMLPLLFLIHLFNYFCKLDAKSLNNVRGPESNRICLANFPPTTLCNSFPAVSLLYLSFQYLHPGYTVSKLKRGQKLEVVYVATLIPDSHAYKSKETLKCTLFRCRAMFIKGM